ncbi:unnamed protein product, partial [Musa acuminata subsp. burmannicoides]
MWFASDEWAVADCLRAICGGSDRALIVIRCGGWGWRIVVDQTREGGAACFLAQLKEDSGTRYVCIYLY